MTASTTHYTDWVDYPFLRLRFQLTTDRGHVETFVIQLEYDCYYLSPARDEWNAVSRFDHNPAVEWAHDITTEGLHMDLLDVDGQKVDVRRSFDDVSLYAAPRYCENYLRENYRTLGAHFEDVSDCWGAYSTPQMPNH